MIFIICYLIQKGGEIIMLNAKAFGLAAGVTWAIGALLLALLANFLGYGTDIVSLVGTVYIGYAPTIVGAIIGAIWGFIDAFIGCYIFVWLYNKFAE